MQNPSLHGQSSCYNHNHSLEKVRVESNEKHNLTFLGLVRFHTKMTFTDFSLHLRDVSFTQVADPVPSFSDPSYKWHWYPS